MFKTNLSTSFEFNLPVLYFSIHMFQVICVHSWRTSSSLFSYLKLQYFFIFLYISSNIQKSFFFRLNLFTKIKYKMEHRKEKTNTLPNGENNVENQLRLEPARDEMPAKKRLKTSNDDMKMEQR